MLVLNVVRYSVIGLSLFFGAVSAMNVDNEHCIESENSKVLQPREVISTAKGRNDEGLKELLTKAAGDDVLLKEIVDYLGSAESNSREAHLVSSCMYYIYKDALKNAPDKAKHYDKVSELFGSIASLRNFYGNGREISLLRIWKEYDGTAKPIVCDWSTNQEYGWW